MVDINPFIQTTFGAIIGGGVVVATNWIVTRREKQRSTQEWYEQRYITEGVDCITTYFTYLLLCFLNSDETDMVSVPNTPIPVEALTRIEFLLGRRETVSGGIEGLSVLILQIHRCLGSRSDKYGDSAIDALFDLFDVLVQLRQELLTLIPTKIKRKSQQLEISNFGDRILLISEELGAKIEELFPTVASKRNAIQKQF